MKNRCRKVWEVEFVKVDDSEDKDVWVIAETLTEAVKKAGSYFGKEWQLNKAELIGEIDVF